MANSFSLKDSEELRNLILMARFVQMKGRLEKKSFLSVRELSLLLKIKPWQVRRLCRAPPISEKHDV